jgi:hypothetical protein
MTSRETGILDLNIKGISILKAGYNQPGVESIPQSVWAMFGAQ